MSTLSLFPGSGHLFITAGMDASVRVSSYGSIIIIPRPRIVCGRDTVVVVFFQCHFDILSVTPTVKCARVVIIC